MYGAEPVNEESERTAFRKAEKKYKIYYENAKKHVFLTCNFDSIQKFAVFLFLIHVR